jgi:hypothetical protein
MVFDICAKHGIGEAAFYNRKSKYGGMNLNELKRLKAHEPNFVVLLVSLFLSEITLSELKFGVAISQNIVRNLLALNRVCINQGFDAISILDSIKYWLQTLRKS